MQRQRVGRSTLPRTGTWRRLRSRADERLRDAVNSDPEHLHHFVAQVVDDLDGDAAGSGFREGAGGVAVQSGPGVGVDFGFQGGSERLVGVAGAEEVGLADEEALFVVVGVDEPAGDAFGAVAADFAGGWVEDVDAVDLDL